MTPAKCPNPACPFLFDPSQVPPGAIIACPRCGMRFTLPPPPTPTLPLYGSDPTEDLGLVEERPNTDDLPTEERPRPGRRKGKDSHEPREQRELDDLEPPHRTTSSGSWKVIVFAVLAVLVICGVLAGVLYWKSLKQGGGDAGPDGPRKVVNEKLGLEYKSPTANWEADRGLQDRFKSTVLGIRSREPVGWIVLDARQMAHTPNKNELREMVQAVLEANGELKGPVTEEPATLGGVPGVRFTYECLMNDLEDVKGEVYAAGYQGVAYFVYSFAPEKKVGDIAQAFVDFREGIKVIAKPKSGSGVGFKKVFRSRDGGYSLTATENLWRELSEPASQDMAADLGLVGTITVPRGIKPDPATVLVLILEKGADPKAYMSEKLLARVGFNLELKDITDGLQGDDPPAGAPEPPESLKRYEARYAGGNADSRKYVAVNIRDGKDKRYVAVGTCVLNQRASWEKRLVQIVGSLGPAE